MYAMNTEQAAAYIGVGVNRLRELAKKKEIPSAKVGKNLRFFRPQLEEYAEKKARDHEQL